MNTTSAGSKSGQPIEIEYVNLDATQLSDEQSRIVARFVDVYQRLNELSAKLGEKSPEQLKAIEKALIERDELENEHAPMGILVEPEYRDSVAVRLEVTVGSMKAGTRAAQVWISSSALLDFS